MDYTSRKDSPIDIYLWEYMDKNVVNTVRSHLICRRFLNVFGPLGPGTQSVEINKGNKFEETKNGFTKITGHSICELPQINQDFSILWRDIEHSKNSHYPLDISNLKAAAQNIAYKEDSLILLGNQFLDIEGIYSDKRKNRININEWSEDENAFEDIISAIKLLNDHSIIGKYVLCLSLELYQSLQRIQTGTGITEYKRISKLLDGYIYKSNIIPKGKAILICTEPQYVDIAIGVDIVTAYLEQKDLNHCFRIFETIIPRIKNEDSIVIFE